MRRQGVVCIRILLDLRTISQKKAPRWYDQLSFSIGEESKTTTRPYQHEQVQVLDEGALANLVAQHRQKRVLHRRQHREQNQLVLVLTRLYRARWGRASDTNRNESHNQTRRSEFRLMVCNMQYVATDGKRNVEQESPPQGGMLEGRKKSPQ